MSCQNQQVSPLVAAKTHSRGFATGSTIHELFQAQAERSPDAVAVVFGKEQLTYRELNDRANRLAYRLQARGVRPEILVGICVGRSTELIVGLLGILKAGGAYVPLDSAYPEEHLSLILKDIKTPLLLTEQRWVENLAFQSAPLLILDRPVYDSADNQPRSTRSPESGAESDNLAYVMYTSGSTGRSKGVCATHRGVVRLVKDANYGLNANEVVLQFAPFSFDASTFEIWVCLLNGGCLVISPPENLSLGQLGQVIRENKVTTLFLTSALFHQMVDGPIESLRGVRQLLTGGDVVSPPHVEKFLRRFPGGRLLSCYGPTENTVFTTCYPMTSVEQVGTSVSIGRPIAGTQVYVLDEQLRPVRTNDVGELYAGGDGLARAYLAQPDLTAERFIPNPLSENPGDRLYRTGDMVRCLTDGNIEFVGRVDHQVKIRGFRIELGEVEVSLRLHPGIKDAVVTAFEASAGENQLVGYYVPQPNQKPSADDVRTFLRRKLPAFMIPTTFVQLESWPLSPNGKVDRRALPAPDRIRRGLETTLVAPRTAAEKAVLQIWEEILGLKEIGVEDNFIALGGHSLAATKILSRLQSLFDLSLPFDVFFRHPTIAQLSRIIETKGSGTRRLPLSPIDRASRDDQSIPLSFQQEQVWFLNQLAPGNLAYNAQISVHLRGPLDVRVLERVLSEIVRRHEILRTTFPAVNHRPTQVIHGPWPINLPVMDLASLPAAERELQATKLMDEEFGKPFDVETLPLVRWTLLRLGDEEHLLLQAEHHLVHDGWSLAILLREIKLIYVAFAAGQPSPLPELPIQYADYAVWQRRWLDQDNMSRELAHWKNKLAGTIVNLELPTDHPRPEVQSFRGAAPRVELSQSLYESLRRLSRNEGVTLFMTMLAAFKVLLHRYTGQTDILVGTAIANRQLPEAEGLLGMFVNSIVLRSGLAGNPTFREVLGRVRETTLEAYLHQDTPFTRLVEALQPDRDPSRNPLFQVMFSFHDSQVPDLEFAGLSGTVLERHNGSAKIDLALVIVPRSEQRLGLGPTAGTEKLAIIWEYNTDLFEASTIARMMGHFETLLKAAVANPDAPIAELGLLCPSERRQLLVEWNQTTAEYARSQCLHQLFDSQVERTPDALALVSGDSQMTYRELNHRANRLAHHLQALGAGPDTLVGLHLERSPELVVALLAVLKAGGAYVPLDPSYPAERLSFLIRDARVPLLITQSHLVSLLPQPSPQIVWLDREQEAIERRPRQNPVAAVSAENLAYVIYTSGSTGQPKGVMISHRAICNHMMWMQRAFPLSASDRVLQRTSPSFDASVWEFFAPLSAGAGLVLASANRHLVGADYLTAIKRHQITVLQCVPSLFRLLVEEPHFGTCVSLKRIFCGGEVLTADLVDRCLSALPGTTVHNLYGPTEAAIDSTVWTGAGRSERPVIPIGRPIDNVRTYTLDGHGQMVPVGVPGELLIGGAGLARGYLNEPALTAERFIPDSIGQQPGSRLYKTGDVVRYLPDGNVEFLGRVDNQVKIRGFRIELSEIEVTLARHSGVRECVVVLREDVSGDKRLTAYLAPRNEAKFSVSELRKFLGEKLPEYMIPSAFVILNAIPRSPNGKVDRRALPLPGDQRPALAETFVAPQTPVQEVVNQIWREVLNLERIGIHDDFFELGGHSLLATQVISRMRNIYGVDIPMHRLFQTPTIAELADFVEKLILSRLAELSEEEVRCISATQHQGSPG